MKRKSFALTIAFLFVLSAVVLSACGGAATEVVGGDTMTFDYVSPALQTVVVGSTLGAGIFWLLLALIVGGVAAGLLYMFLSTSSSIDMKKSTIYISTVLVFLVLFGGIFGTAFYKASYVEIQSNQIGVLLRQGKAVETAQPGGHFMTAFLEKMVIYPTTEFTFTTVSDPATRGSEQYRTYKMPIVTVDNVNGEVAFQVQFKVDPSNAIALYNGYGSLENAIVQLIKGPALGEVKAQMAGKTAEEIISDFGKMSPDMEEAIRTKMEEGGLIMTVFDFRLPDFGEWQAARNQAQLNLQLAQAEINANELIIAQEANKNTQADNEKIRALILAQQQAESAVIAAQGAADAKLIQAKAEADAALLAAQAEAQGNILKAESITPELIKYLLALGWDGANPQTVLSPDTGIIIQP